MPDTRHKPTLSNVSLHYVLLLRSIAMAGEAIGLLVLQRALHVQLPWLSLTVTLVILFLFTLVSWWRIHEGLQAGETTLLIQLLVDVSALTVLLYFIDGSSNPLVSLFLLPVTVAAATLRPRLSGIGQGPVATRISGTECSTM